MRGATPRGGAPRGAYVFRIPPIAAQVIESATCADAFDVQVGVLGVVEEHAIAEYIAISQAIAFYQDVAASSDTLAATGHDSGHIDSHATATDLVDVASVLLVQIESGAITMDEFVALAKAAATIVEAASAGFTTIAAESGSTPVFAAEAVIASDAYTAAAMAYGQMTGAATAADAMAATEHALARYAAPAVARDMQYASASTDSSGPLRGAINITAAVRGTVRVAPSPGPKGGTPH